MDTGVPEHRRAGHPLADAGAPPKLRAVPCRSPATELALVTERAQRPCAGGEKNGARFGRRWMRNGLSPATS
jgi:hypothetical protein